MFQSCSKCGVLQLVSVFIRDLQLRDAALDDGVSEAARTVQPLELHLDDFCGDCSELSCRVLGGSSRDNPLMKDTF